MSKEKLYWCEEWRCERCQNVREDVVFHRKDFSYQQFMKLMNGTSNVNYWACNVCHKMTLQTRIAFDHDDYQKD